MHTIYLIQIFTTLLHISVYLTSSSGRTDVFLTQNYLSQSYCPWYICCVVNIKYTTLLVYNIFTVIKILVACFFVC